MGGPEPPTGDRTGHFAAVRRTALTTRLRGKLTRSVPFDGGAINASGGCDWFVGIGSRVVSPALALVQRAVVWRCLRWREGRSWPPGRIRTSIFRSRLLGRSSFRARVAFCPVGDSPSIAFSLPFEGTQLEMLMLKLDPGRSGTRRAGVDPQRQASLDLGGALFEAVFRDEVLLAWSRSQDLTRTAGQGLRLRLRLTDAPQIAGLPWELLYDRRANNYVAQSERTPLVRYLEVPYPPRPLAVGGPLHILVVLAAPTDLPDLDVEAEWHRVRNAMSTQVANGTVVIERLPVPTMAELIAWLRREAVHVLHFVGHGDYDERTQSGVLYFCDRYGRSVAVGADTLGPFLHDHDPLRFVFLNACRSARVDATDPYSGMAQGLVQQDVTAVVAMQFPISDGAAVAFTSAFYGAVSDGIPVDQAATWARKELLISHPGEWATPVLFSRAPDGRVFCISA